MLHNRIELLSLDNNLNVTWTCYRHSYLDILKCLHPLFKKRFLPWVKIEIWQISKGDISYITNFRNRKMRLGVRTKRMENEKN